MFPSCRAAQPHLMQRITRRGGQLKKMSMLRIAFVLTISAFPFLLAGCKKNNAQDEAALYGTWVKGANAGDTLRFMKKNNQYILRQNESFNAAMPVYSEKEYRFRDGKLGIKLYSPSSQEYYSIGSFAWTQAGSEFTLQGIQLFLFMSSTLTYFTYRKID